MFSIFLKFFGLRKDKKPSSRSLDSVDFLDNVDYSILDKGYRPSMSLLKVSVVHSTIYVFNSKLKQAIISIKEKRLIYSDRDYGELTEVYYSHFLNNIGNDISLQVFLKEFVDNMKLFITLYSDLEKKLSPDINEQKIIRVNQMLFLSACSLSEQLYIMSNRLKKI